MRKELHDQIITQISALTFDGSANLLFADVQKIYKEQPLGFPIARVIATTVGVEVMGLDYDQKNMGFQIDVFDLLDEGVTQDEAETRIDRMSNTEDILLEWVEAIPNNIENSVSGVHINTVEILNGGFSYDNNENGIMLNLAIPFQLKTEVYTKGL